jgi:hypothetical protein
VTAAEHQGQLYGAGVGGASDMAVFVPSRWAGPLESSYPSAGGASLACEAAEEARMLWWSQSC